MTYKDKKTPVLSIKDALKKEEALAQVLVWGKRTNHCPQEGREKEGRVTSLKWEEGRQGCHWIPGRDATGLAGKKIEDDEGNTTVTGEMEIGSQLHMHLETQSTICRWKNG